MRTLAFGFLLVLVSCGTNPADSDSPSSGSNSASPSASVDPSTPGSSASSSTSPTSSIGSTDGQGTAAFRQLLTAGSRLSVLTTTGDDGSSMEESFFDSQYQMPCSLQIATDGNKRCLPSQGLAAEPNFFSDSQCSSAVLSGSSAAAFNSSLPYLSYASSSVCGAFSPSVYQGAISVSASALYTNFVLWSTTPSATHFTCGPVSVINAGPITVCYLFYKPGTIIAPSNFVSFH